MPDNKKDVNIENNVEETKVGVEAMTSEAVSSEKNETEAVTEAVAEAPKRKRRRSKKSISDTLSALSNALGDDYEAPAGGDGEVKPLVRKSKEEIKNALIYGEDSIKENDGPNGVRKRPATLLGSDDIRGCENAIFEIVANGVDEVREGFGSRLEVEYYEDDSVRVKDYGRGVPMGWNEASEKYNWELVYCTLYASGKGKGSSYSSSEGLNGVGCTATQYTSDFMTVTSVRDADDGKRYKYVKHFEWGYPVGDLAVTETNEPTGTEVFFRPSLRMSPESSETVFTDIDVPYESISKRLRLKAVAVDGIEIILKYKDMPAESYYYEKGKEEYLSTSLKDIIGGTIKISGENLACNDTKDKNPDLTYIGTVEMALAFSFSDNLCQMFHNGAILTGGPSKNAVYESVAKLLTDEGIKNGKLKKGEKINVRDIEDILSVVCETRCPSDFSKYENQTKTELNNPSLCKLIQTTVKEKLGLWFLQNTESFDKILSAAIINKTSRESAERLRSNSLKKIQSNINKVGNAPEKFLPCTSTKASECEVYIMEGESAKGSIVSSRDRTFQAAMPLRGKIPNCLKKGLDSLLQEGSVIVDLLTILGCGIELSAEERKKAKDIPKFDINKLNFNKIIIATDADVDGGHITCLLLTMFWRLCPQILKDGHVYVAKSPLFKVTYGKKSEKHKYFYTDEEKDDFVATLKEEHTPNVDVSRFKGLGEMQPEDMADTIMQPKTRCLVQVEYPENEEELANICSALLGSDIETRKQWIDEYFTSVEVIVE